MVEEAVLSDVSGKRRNRPSIYILRKGARIEAELWAIDAVADLAILKIPLQLPKPWSLSVSDPQQGEELMGMGYPGFADFSILPGRFQSSKISSMSPLYQISMALEPGMSGGPVLNQRREVIGVNSARYFTGGDAALLSQSQSLARLIQGASSRKKMSNELVLFQQISESIQVLQEQKAAVLKTVLSKKTEFSDWLVAGGGDHPELVCTETEKDDLEDKPLRSRSCVSKFRGLEGHVNFRFVFRSFDVKENQFKSAYQSGWLINSDTKLVSQPTRYGRLVCEPDLHLRRESHSWVISICSRSNKRFSDMVQTVVRMASLDFTRPALVGQFELAGFSEKNTKELVLKFLDVSASGKDRGRSERQ